MSLNERGQGLSTNAIILIVLGVIVLAVLVIGFTVGWNKIAPFISQNNVESVATQCETACSTQNTYSYCTRGRELTSDTETLEGVTCNFLAQERTEYGIQSCQTISCDFIVVLGEEDIIGDFDESECVGNEGKIIQALVDGRLQQIDCSNVEISGSGSASGPSSGSELEQYEENPDIIE